MLKQARQLHLYLGTFFAPAIIFFSLTGALQTFGLHESRGGTRHPAWIAELASIHKDQTLPQPRPAMRPPAGASGGEAKPPAGPAAEPIRRGPSPLPLKIFVLFMALGLISTTLLGIYMAFKYNPKNQKLVWGLLLGGIVLPLLLLFL